MTEDKLRELEEYLEENHVTREAVTGDKKLMGFNLISKYTNDVIIGAEHDTIYCGDIETMLEAGLTKEDATKLLQDYGFHLEDYSFGRFC